MARSDPDQPKRRRSVRRQEERQLRNQINRYNRLFQIGQLITSEMDFDALFEVIAKQINELMDSERCSIFLIDQNQAHLTAFVSTDLKRNEIKVPINSGVAGWVYTNKTPLVVPDAYADHRFYPGIDEKTGFRTKNILSVPLINGEYKCIGTLQTLNKKSGPFTGDDKEILLHLANYVTIALENSRLYEELKNSDMAKQKVINHLSHELRTPLAIISSAFELIKRESVTTNDKHLQATIARGKRSLDRLTRLQEKVDDIIKERPIEEGTRILSMIEDTVDLMEELDENTAGQYEKMIGLLRDRIESIFKVEETRMENIELNTFFNDILARQLPSGQRDYPEIITSIEKDLQIFTDRRVLKKVLVGLLKNAIENTPDQGLINVSAFSTPRYIIIEIQDCGIGITVEHQKNIFSGFFPARSTSLYTSKKPYEFSAGGAGLDLLRIKMFAEQFDFTVDFESTRCEYIALETDRCPGKISDCEHITDRPGCLSSGGSKFTITFPKN